jgi:hypothetical protein
MNKLQAGYAAVNITPPFGIPLAGYFIERPMDGVLDDLQICALALSDGENKAVIMVADLLGIRAVDLNPVRQAVAKRLNMAVEGVFIACTHTHTAPQISENTTGKLPEKWHFYQDMLYARFVDAADLAFQDLAPAKMGYAVGNAPHIAFIRRYRMKDGSVRTNPGVNNPDILAPIGTVDERVNLLRFVREKGDIALVNFGVHPDTIGGCKVSADYPKFVRDTYEANIPNSLCMYLNGAQGDTNHVDVRLGPDQLRGGYKRAEYMGRKIAMSVLSNYLLAQPLQGEKVRFAQNELVCRHNKGLPEHMEEARRIYAVYKKEGDKAARAAAKEKMILTMWAAVRMISLQHEDDEKALHLTALAVGDVVFAGFPGEPFTEIGRSIKKNSPFTVTIPCCAANGYEDYFPMQDAFDEEGYEAQAALYVGGTAERMIEASSKLVSDLY